MRFFLKIGMLLIMLVVAVFWNLSIDIHSARAQEPITQKELPLADSLGLEYLNGTTNVLEKTIKVGNLPTNQTLMCYAPRQILSDTVYYRGYLRFDLHQIPRGSDLIQAHLLLTVEQFEYGYLTLPSPEAKIDCGIYQVREDWSPITMQKWGKRPAVVTDVVTHTTLRFRQTGVYTTDVTSLVRKWIDGSPNYGVMLGMYPDPNGLADFTALINGTKPPSDASLSPHLNVTYREPPTKTIYLPLMMYTGKPDLIIKNIQLFPLKVLIANNGNEDTDMFWLDLGIDPQHEPEVNQAWHQWGSDYGAAWEVPALRAGEIMTLTISDAWYNVEQSRWPEGFGAGEHTLWAYVDSWGYPRPYGSIQESNENNNRYGPMVFTTSGALLNEKKDQVFEPIPVRPLYIEGDKQ
jgi:hypothetical protein